MSNGEQAFPSRQEVEQVDNAIHRVVVLRNPESTSAKTEESRLRLVEFESSLEDKYGYELIETTGVWANDKNLIQDTLVKGDVLCVVGGDGTANLGINALLSPKLYDLSIPLLPLWGGNGMDLAKSLNSWSARKNPIEIIERGRMVSIHPMKLTINEDLIRLAVLYAGFGVTPKVMAKLNSSEYRDRQPENEELLYKFAREAGVTAGIMLPPKGAEGIIIKDAEGERLIYDITFANGPRYARFKPFRMVKLTSPNRFKVTLERNDSFSIANWAGRLAVGKPKGDLLKDDEEYEFLLKSPTIMHFDAEDLELPADTSIKISRDDRAFMALSTRLLPKRI